MSKILSASCEGGVVTAENVEVDSPRILSKGIGASEGSVILDGDEDPVYFTSSATDVEDCIEGSVSGLQEAATGLGACSTALASVGANPLLLVPIATAGAGITAAVASLNELKGRLK
jgi:hypothetical protein